MPVIYNFKLLYLAVWHSRIYQFQLMNADLAKILLSFLFCSMVQLYITVSSMQLNEIDYKSAVQFLNFWCPFWGLCNESNENI